MPIELERKSRKEARQLALAAKHKKEAIEAYVYCSLRRMGWKPEREKK